MKYTNQEIRSFLSDLPADRLPRGIEKSLSEKRNEILNGKEYRPYLAEIFNKAEEYRQRPIEALRFSEFRLFFETGDREIYQKSYFDRRGRLAALALSVWLRRRPEDISALEDTIWAICDEYTWALPAHIGGPEHPESRGYTVDLFTAETASALAEITALLGGCLSHVVTERARLAVRERVIGRFLSESFGWEHLNNNWAAVCGGAVGIAAMYLCGLDELSEIIFRLQTAAESYISGFPADGAGTEGVSYWSYGFTFFTSFAEMLLRLSRGRLDLFDDPRVKNIALFQQKAYFPFGGMVKFGDCSESDVSRWWGLCGYLGSRYSEIEFLPRPLLPRFESDSCYRWAGIFRDLVWSVRPPERGESFRSYILPDAQWLIASGENRSGIAVKAGHNGESHNHNDVGEIEYYLNGDEVLLDYGSGLYDRDYFGAGRYERFECGSQGHSVPIVNGCCQKAGREFHAADVEIFPDGMKMDLAPAYGLDCLISLKRSVLFDKSTGGLKIADSFEFSEPPKSLTERFVSFSEPEVSGERVILRGKNGTAVMTYPAGDFCAEVSSRPAPRPEDKRKIYIIDFRLRSPAKSVSFTAACCLPGDVPEDL